MYGFYVVCCYVWVYVDVKCVGGLVDFDDLIVRVVVLFIELGMGVWIVYKFD